jgi:hypothetical protein
VASRVVRSSSNWPTSLCVVRLSRTTVTGSGVRPSLAQLYKRTVAICLSPTGAFFEATNFPVEQVRVRRARDCHQRTDHSHLPTLVPSLR